MAQEVFFCGHAVQVEALRVRVFVDQDGHHILSAIDSHRRTDQGRDTMQADGRLGVDPAGALWPSIARR